MAFPLKACHIRPGDGIEATKFASDPEFRDHAYAGYVRVAAVAAGLAWVSLTLNLTGNYYEPRPPKFRFMLVPAAEYFQTIREEASV